MIGGPGFVGPTLVGLLLMAIAAISALNVR